MFRKKAVVLLFLLCLIPITLGAADTKKDGIAYTATTNTVRSTATIVGPTTATVGSTVFLKLSEPADWVSWLMLPADANASFMSFQSYLGMSPDGKPILSHIAIFSTMTPGTYYFSVAASNQVHVVHTLTITGVGPQPNPDPGPEPPIPPIPPVPGKRLVFLLRETGAPTINLSKTIQGLRKYAQQKDHVWRLEDPDYKDKDNKVPEWFQTCQKEAVSQGIVAPTLFIGVFGEDDKTVTSIKVIPLDPKTITAEKAIELVKENGG